jgi:hypothetical protein
MGHSPKKNMPPHFKKPCEQAFGFSKCPAACEGQIPVDNMHFNSIDKIVLRLYKMLGFLSIY